MNRSWRHIVDLIKHKPLMLRIADQLGRGRGRFRMLDDVISPARAAAKPDLSNWETQTIAAAWVGHATTLLRIGKKTILTDPVFSSRVGIGLGLLTAGPKRLIAPSLQLSELPPIDLILLSHAHFDHLDRPTLMRMDKRIPVITASHTADLIADLGFKTVTELSWHQAASIDSLQITALPAVHWGARTFQDRQRGYNGYLMRSSDVTILYGGDSAYHEMFTSLDPVTLAILGIGAYDPYVSAHATPEQAWTMAGHARAEYLFPMHHSTFRLSHEPVGEPIHRLIHAANGSANQIVIQSPGGQWSKA